MKKFISFILAFTVNICCFSIGAFAAENGGWYATLSVNGEDTCFIKNDYFKNNCDELLEKAYSEYLSSLQTIQEDEVFGIYYIRDLFKGDEIQKIPANLYSSISNSEDTFYISITLNYSENFSTEKNLQIISRIDSIEDILYVGSTTPCAVVSIIGGSSIDNLINNEDIIYINSAFAGLHSSPIIAMAIWERTFSPTASDARQILRYAANLEDDLSLSDLSKKASYFLADTNLDNQINAADARTALRISAKLETGNYYYSSTITFFSR